MRPVSRYARTRYNAPSERIIVHTHVPLTLPLETDDAPKSCRPSPFLRAAIFPKGVIFRLLDGEVEHLMLPGQLLLEVHDSGALHAVPGTCPFI